MTPTLETPAAKPPPKSKAQTLPKRMEAMEEGYGIKYGGCDNYGADIWFVGQVLDGGELDPAHTYEVGAVVDEPIFCACPSREAICKHRRFLYRHLHQDKQRGPCPVCAAQERGGVLFSECRQFAGGSLYYHKCDVCDYERALI